MRTLRCMITTFENWLDKIFVDTENNHFESNINNNHFNRRIKSASDVYEKLRQRLTEGETIK